MGDNSGKLYPLLSLTRFEKERQSRVSSLLIDWPDYLSQLLFLPFILKQGALEKSPSFCSSRPVTFPLFLKSWNPFFLLPEKKYFNSHITTPGPLSLYYFSGFITREVFMNNCFVNDISWVKFNVKLYMEDKRGLRGGCRDRQKYRKENWNIFSFLRSWNKLDVWAPTCVLMACLARFFLPDFFLMLALLPINYFLAQIPLEPPHLPLLLNVQPSHIKLSSPSEASHS